MTSTAPPLEGSTTASPWVPLWRIIERIASAIGDSREPEHYARTRLCIRQAALDGRLRIRGRHELEGAGQDRTNFSDVYTDIPLAYWKHSVINVLATGATYEADRHTNPETVYAWGPKGLHETNCYAGLQLNSDDVSQLIGEARGAGFSSDAPMSEKKGWINAASAVNLLGMKHLLGTRTICKRAHAGLIKARAERFIRDGRSADNIDVPVEFWWAEGEAALHQNWTTGDFDTWIDHRIHLQAFGVTFWRSDIERSKPPPLVENAASPASTTPRHLTSLLVRLQHASAPELDDTLQKLLNYPDALDQVMQIVGSRIDAGVYIRNESLASLILRTCFSHLYEKVRERLLKDHWTALTLYKSQYPDPEIEKKLCDRLYKIASDDAQPLRRCIVDAMREVGSEAVLPTLEAILFDLEPSAIIRPSASDLLAGLEAKSRAEFLSSVALSIEDIKSRAASAAEAVGVVGTPEEPSRGPGPAPNELGTIFISYSRDSALHEEKVLSLSDKLRSEGIDCILDQYESSPPEGWPKWMDREIIKAKFVL